MNILLLSAYHARSHAYWTEQLHQRLPEFNWRQLSLSPRYFNWRIRGNPLSWLTLSQDIADFNADLIVATSMVDLATLRGLQPQLAHLPALVYCHENQFAYPQSDSAPARLEPLMVNLYSALSADCLCFNSDFNQSSFMVGLEAFLKRMPDELDMHAVLSELQAKSRVLPVPLKPLPWKQAPETRPRSGQNEDETPIVLWNHRWEFDKGPEQLLAAVRVFQAAGERVRWAIVGESFRKRPAAFDQIEAMAEQGDIELYRWGFIENQDDYRQLLCVATLVLSTALHDFQGLAIQEAVLAGACPLVPDRLAYPQWFAAQHRYRSFPEQPELESKALLASYRALKSAGWPDVDLSALCGEALIAEWREQLLQTVAHGRPGAGG